MQTVVRKHRFFFCSRSIICPWKCVNQFKSICYKHTVNLVWKLSFEYGNNIYQTLTAHTFNHVEGISGTIYGHLSQITSVRHIQSVSVTDSLCLSQTICVCYWQSLSVSDSLCQSQTVYLCYRQSVWITDSLCLSQTICVTDIMFLSQTVYVRHRQ